MTEREYTDAEIRKFKRAAKALAELARSGATLYLANDSLHLMSGPSHDAGRGCRARQDRIVETVLIPGAGGGDW